MTGSSFRFSDGSAGAGFDGRTDEVSLAGEVVSAMVGADFNRGSGTVGIALVHSSGNGSYSGAGGDDVEGGDVNEGGEDESVEGRVKSTLTGLYPYGRYELSDRLSLWGIAGWGTGTLTLTPERGARIETDINMQMAAAGVRGVLAEAPAAGGVEIAARADGLMLNISSDAARGDDANSLLAAADADVTRFRLGLEATGRGLGTGGGGALKPKLEVGLRHDGGDAESGLGIEAGVGIAWTAPASGITVDLNARGLLAHEDGGFRERGLSGSFAWDPATGSDRGPSLALTQTLEKSATYDVDALFGDGAPAGLAANDNDDPDARRIEAMFGYGFGTFGGRFTLTPEVNLGLSNDSREYGLGWWLNPSTGDRSSLELRLDATRREAVNDDGAGSKPGHAVGLKFRATS